MVVALEALNASIMAAIFKPVAPDKPTCADGINIAVAPAKSGTYKPAIFSSNVESGNMLKWRSVGIALVASSKESATRFSVNKSKHTPLGLPVVPDV